LEAFGIIPTPAVKKFDITQDVFAIVLTTDGVTDALTDDDIIKIVNTYVYRLRTPMKCLIMLIA
jgi:serine/threonine protein phosphatase PrpC